MVEKNELDKKQALAYEWAINEATKYVKVCIAQVARDATSRFDLEVKTDTVGKIIYRGGLSIFVTLDRRENLLTMKWKHLKLRSSLFLLYRRQIVMKKRVEK